MRCWECKGSTTHVTGSYVLPLDKGTLTITDVPFEQCMQCGERWLQASVAETIEKAVMEFKNSKAIDSTVSYLAYLD